MPLISQSGNTNTMKDDVTRKLADLVSRREPLSESEVSHLMALFRKRLEHMPREDRGNYPVLKFFCNWVLHITLDRSLEGMAILKRINDILFECAADHTDLVRAKVTEAISFRHLRREMRTLLGYLQTEPVIVDDQAQWENFALKLIEIVRDCELVFGENMAREARALYAAVTAKPLSNRSWVVAVSMLEVDYGELTGGTVSKKLFCLHVLMSDTTHIMIPMDRREVFGPPDEADVHAMR
jgi:hypothetical protein